MTVPQHLTVFSPAEFPDELEVVLVAPLNDVLLVVPVLARALAVHVHVEARVSLTEEAVLQADLSDCQLCK